MSPTISRKLAARCLRICICFTATSLSGPASSAATGVINADISPLREAMRDTSP